MALLCAFGTWRSNQAPDEQATRFESSVNTLASSVEQLKARLDSLEVSGGAGTAEIREEVKVAVQQEMQAAQKVQEEGWQKVDRKLSQQADAKRRKEKALNARLTNFEEVEGETAAALLERLKKTLSTQLKVHVDITAAQRQSAKRSYAAAAKGEPQAATPPVNRPCPLLLTFPSLAARSAVFRARKGLAGTFWGLDDDLTPLQQSQRKALQPQWLEARKAGKRPHWRGGELFVDGLAVKPST